MSRATIIYKADQEVFGRHLHSNEWILYTGTLTIYDRKTYPVVLKLKSEVYDSFLSELLEDKKQFKGDSVSNVYGKVSKWYYSSGIILKN